SAFENPVYPKPAMTRPMPRRDALKKAASGAAALAAAGAFAPRALAADRDSPLKGNIRHSACKWCYPKQSLEELCVAGKRIGLEAIDLVNIDEAAILKRHGMTASMV